MSEMMERISTGMRHSQTLRLLTVGLFAILGLIMYATRKVDWYQAGAK